MSEKRTVLEQLANRFFAIPAIAQWWAKGAAVRTQELLQDDQTIPFTPLRKALGQCRVALLTTGGIHLPTQPPFNMDDPDGDASYRMIPGDVALETVTITHKYYDHSDADRDLNVIFPLAHLRELVTAGVIGSLASNHFGFMGHIEGAQIPMLNTQTAPAAAKLLRADGVDVALLTPA